LETRIQDLQSDLMISMSDCTALTTEEGYRCARVAMAGRRSCSVTRLESARPDLVEELEKSGVITLGKGSAHVRVTGPKEKKNG
jgi:hypothetical protein